MALPSEDVSIKPAVPLPDIFNPWAVRAHNKIFGKKDR
jgi:hypothetical protein